jgi:translation elongation factor EF-Tu-like GTPase
LDIEIPEPQLDQEKPFILSIDIDQTFTIEGRGVVATG